MRWAQAHPQDDLRRRRDATVPQQNSRRPLPDPTEMNEARGHTTTAHQWDDFWAWSTATDLKQERLANGERPRGRQGCATRRLHCAASSKPANEGRMSGRNEWRFGGSFAEAGLEHKHAEACTRPTRNRLEEARDGLYTKHGRREQLGRRFVNDHGSGPTTRRSLSSRPRQVYRHRRSTISRRVEHVMEGPTAAAPATTSCPRRTTRGVGQRNAECEPRGLLEEDMPGPKSAGPDRQAPALQHAAALAAEETKTARLFRDATSSTTRSRNAPPRRGRQRHCGRDSPHHRPQLLYSG